MRKSNLETEKAAGYLIGNKIATRITKFFKKNSQNNSETIANDKERPKKGYIS